MSKEGEEGCIGWWARRGAGGSRKGRRPMSFVWFCEGEEVQSCSHYVCDLSEQIDSSTEYNG
jgi:hypothetical protein